MAEGTPTSSFPEREVRLLSGEHVTVAPWKLKMGRHMRKRIGDLFNKLQEVRAGTAAGEAVDYDALIDLFEADIIEIIRDTLGKDDAWMDEHLAYEDLFTLTQAILEVCLFRSADGGGLMGKLLGMAGGALTDHPEILAQILGRLATGTEDTLSKTSATKSETSSSPEDSLSLPDGGEPTPKPSENS